MIDLLPEAEMAWLMPHHKGLSEDVLHNFALTLPTSPRPCPAYRTVAGAGTAASNAPPIAARREHRMPPTERPSRTWGSNSHMDERMNNLAEPPSLA
jgi:hypothetical protein